MANWTELKEKMIAEIHENKEEVLEEHYQQDMLADSYADSWTPVYDRERLELALSKNSLAIIVPELIDCIGEKNPSNIIALNIYEELRIIAVQEFERIIEEEQERYE